jgi:hypothetical protein
MARPTKLTPEVQERLLKALRAGNYLSTAARFAGIHPATLHRWLERGDPAGTRPTDLPYRQFAEQVERAIAEAEVRDVTLISKAAETDWRAAAWRLARRYPKQWGDSTRRQDGANEAASADGQRWHTAIARLKELPNDQLEQLARSLGIEQSRAEHQPMQPPSLLPLCQAIWDELYERKVPLNAEDHSNWAHQLLQTLSAGTDRDLADLEAARDEIAARRGLPPRPGG